MKKMLVKAVALSLVLGGVGFVANDALAAEIGNGVKVKSADMGVGGFDVKTDKQLPAGTVLANKKDLVEVNKDAETAKADAKTAKVIATKAYGMAQQEQVDRKFADLQIREDMKKADKELSDKIDANKANIQKKCKQYL